MSGTPPYSLDFLKSCRRLDQWSLLTSFPGFPTVQFLITLKSCILLGDFNVDLLLNNQLSNDLTTMLSSFHFTQVVGEPTRLSKNLASLIDHVYLTDSSLLSFCSTSPPLGYSDHRSITLSLNWSKCVHLRESLAGSGTILEQIGTLFVLISKIYQLPLMT